MKWNSSHKKSCLLPEQILVHMTEVETLSFCPAGLPILGLFKGLVLMVKK